MSGTRPMHESICLWCHEPITFGADQTPLNDPEKVWICDECGEEM